MEMRQPGFCSRVADSPFVHFLGSAILASQVALFAAVHLSGFWHTGKPSLLVFCMAETGTAACLLLRTQPKSFTRRPSEWAAAILGTFLPLLLRPAGESIIPGAEWGVTLGSVIQLAAALSLNRSYAVVPALREVKTRGMYAVVRHPLYASYILTLSSYLGDNFSLTNLAVLGASISLLLLRIGLEERHLCQNPQYRAYQGQVRWRLIPFIY